MTLRLSLPALLFVCCISKFGYSQCNSNQISISGTMCAGNELLLNSTLLPDSVTWSLAGNVISTQRAVFDMRAETVAGGNGPGSNANQLNNPDRLYVDGAGVMYIPDYNNHRVQKWLPGATAGITVAGGNGAGNAANQLNKPTGVFLDRQGNLYIADQANNRVQKWAPGATQGVTVAGLNNEFNLPTDLFIDANDNLYVSDQNNNVVWKYAPGSTTGVKVAGSSQMDASDKGFDGPTGIYVDAAGNLYVCDAYNRRVQKWAPGATAGTRVAKPWGHPLDVWVDCKGNVYAIDYDNNRIDKFLPGSDNPIPFIGTGQGAGPDQFSSPIGIFLTEYNNALYVADFANHRIQRFSSRINLSFTPQVPGIYTVTAYYKCCPSQSITFEIFKGGLPEINITSTTTVICPGDEVTFFAQNVNRLLQPEYQWTLNGANVGANSDEFKSVTLKNNDILLCILTSPEACRFTPADTSNTIQIKIFDTIPPDLGADVIICPDSIAVLKVASPFKSYLWSDNSTGTQLPVNTAGKYYVTVKDDCNRALSDTILVFVSKLDNHILPADTTICSYDSMVLKPIKISLSNLWSDQTTGNAIVISQPGQYWLQSQDVHHCTVRDSINIYTKTCPPRGIYMPNAFTPDNNGRNDVLKPVIYGTLKKYKFCVFNRYGQMVFNATDPKKGWNGSINGNMPNAGVYVWYCTFEIEGQKSTTEKGTVVLIK